MPTSQPAAKLPMCQDTGTAIVMGKKGQAVWTGGGDEAAIARGVYKTYTETNLRYSQVSPISMFKEVQTGTKPAGADRHLCDRRRRLQVPVRRQGRRLGQQELSLSADAGSAERGGVAEVPRHPDPHARDRGLPALSPRHRGGRHVGGDEPQDGEAGLDTLSRRPAERGQQQGVAIRDREMEKKVLELTRQMASARSSAASISATMCA